MPFQGNVFGNGRIAAIAGLLALVFLGIPARATLQLNLSTTNSDPSQVYILFQGNQAKFSASYVDATTQQTVPMSLNTHGLSPSIALSSIKGGVITLTEFVSGVIYASVGGPLGTTAAPAPTNPSDPGYNIPWQSVAEITYSGAPADSGDITAIQFFALSSGVQVLGGSKVLQSGGFSVPGAMLLNQIAALSSTPSVDVIKSTKAPNIGQVVRVLAPNQFGGTKDLKGTKYYTVGGFPSFQAYVQAQHQAGATAQIKGSIRGSTYIFTVSADAAGNIIATGNYGTGATYTITLPADKVLTDGTGLTDYIQSWTIYSCPGSVGDGVKVASSDGSTINASVLTQVMHDLCCGYNFGFVNSPTIDPVTHVAFGTETSNLWFKDATPATLYAGLQPAHPYYNQYSALISSASNGSIYGFPYADAVPGVTLDTVIVTGSPSQNVTAWNIIIGDPALGSVPAAPANLKAVPDNGQVHLSWSGVSGATSYNIYRGTKSDGESLTPVATVSSGTTTYTDTGLSNGTLYFYEVAAVNSLGIGPDSNEVSVTSGSGSLSKNLGLNRPATASSMQSSSYPASKAADGNLSTRWSSVFSDPQWIYVDLGSMHSITGVTLNWETAYGKAYSIQVSNDAVSWTTIYSTTTGTGRTENLALSGSGRYVRMYGTKRGTGWGYSLWEFQVFGN
jgi:hypothetical protein